MKDWLILFLPAGCPMSDWSVWSVCSCVSQRQQRYRVALSPAIRGQQCTPVETQSRACSLSQCAGELKKNAKKHALYFLHSILLCFVFYFWHLMGFTFLLSMQTVIHPDYSNSPRSFGRSTGPNWKTFLEKPLKCICTLRWEEQCLPVSFSRPVAPPLDLSFYRVDFIFSLS